jgi:cytoskeletal protein CcmA (bactofilin family)
MSKEDISAFLGTATVYVGHLEFSGAVRIDGKFTGEIRSEGTLILGKEAQVQGQIYVNQLVMSGNISGDIIVADKTVMHRTARLVGNISTKLLVMEEGAVLQGKICMLPESDVPMPKDKNFAAPEADDALSATRQ